MWRLSRCTWTATRPPSPSSPQTHPGLAAAPSASGVRALLIIFLKGNFFLKGLSHEIDFVNFEKKITDLGLSKDAAPLIVI
jgi:hypothetical protein